MTAYEHLFRPGGMLYTVTESTRDAAVELDQGAMEAAIEYWHDRGSEPYVEIVSPAEYERRRRQHDHRN